MSVKKGFTLIELSLSLAFIAILSLTIAFIINDAVASYRRGITLKQINTTGIGLVDDMRAAIQGSSTKSVIDDCKVAYGRRAGGAGIVKRCEDDQARNFVSLTRRADVEGKTVLPNVPVYGAFCTGTYSYFWNSGYFFNKEDSAYKVTGVSSAEVKFNADSSVAENELCKREGVGNAMKCSGFRLLKVRDDSRAFCIATAGENYAIGSVSSMFDMTATSEIVSEEPVDILASDEVNGGLALYNLFVSGPAESTAKNAQFYSISFILGTIQGGANITKSGNLCATPDEYDIENFDYCAINKFNFAAEASGV